jgi:hypothetical protein
MEKIHRLLSWLNMPQALALFHDLTGAALSDEDLLQLCDAGECNAYIDCQGRKGELQEYWDQLPAPLPVTGRGRCKAKYPLQLADPARHGTHVFGTVWIENFPFENKGLSELDCTWWISHGDAPPVPVFKRADILALAAKMDGTSKQPSTAEVEDLRQQLDQERAKREAAEAEAEALRQAMDDDYNARCTAEREEEDKAAERWGEWLREQQKRDALQEQQAAELEQERTAREAAEKRAEIAEAEAKPSHLLTIAALLELLKAPAEHPRPQGMNQEAIKNAILAQFPWRGLSDRNLQTIFSAANKAKESVG